MSGAYGYPQASPPSAKIASALLAVAAALAVGGSFAPLSVFRLDSGVRGVSATTTTSTAWSLEMEPAHESVDSMAPPTGILLVVAGLLALVVAVLLLRPARRPGGGATPMLGVGVAGLLVGSVAVVWIGLLTTARNVAASTASAEASLGPDRARVSFEIGAGASLILGAAVLALVGAVILVTTSRGVPAAVPPPPSGQYGPQPPYNPYAPPYGPGQPYPPPYGAGQPPPAPPGPSWAPQHPAAPLATNVPWTRPAPGAPPHA